MLSTILILAAAASPGTATAAPTLSITRDVLPNGLEVLWSPDRAAPVVGLGLLVRAGAAQEGKGQHGYAHLVEHLLRGGSRHAQAETRARILSAMGGREDLTAHRDAIVLGESGPSHELGQLVWLLADRLGFAAQSISLPRLVQAQQEIAAERKLAGARTLELLFGAPHPYHFGDGDDALHATPAEIERFARAVLAAGNATLVVTGAFDQASARSLVEHYFGSLPGTARAAQAGFVAPPLEHARAEPAQERSGRARVRVAWVGPPRGTPGLAELELTARVLGGGARARLARALAEQPEAGDRPTCDVDVGALGSVFECEIETPAGSRASAAEAAVLAAVAEVRARGVGRSELRAARAELRTNALHELEDRMERARVLAELAHVTPNGQTPALDQDIARHDVVSPESMAAAADEWLDPARRLTLTITPARPAARVTAGEDGVARDDVPRDVDREPWRAQPPPSQAPWPVAVPTVRRMTLRSGVPVLVAENHTLPLVTVKLVVRAGATTDPPGRPGSARLLGRVLADELAPPLAALGATVTSDAVPDGQVLTLDCLRDKLDRALDALSDVARDATLDGDAGERVRREDVADSSVAGAERMLRHAVYGPAHPYTTSDEPADDTRHADLVALYERYWQPSSAQLIVVGDVTPEEVRALLEPRLGRWRRRAGGRSAPTPPLAHAQRGRLRLVDRPHLRSAGLAIGQLGPPRQAADFDVLGLVLEVAVGGYGSRLDTRLERLGIPHATRVFASAAGAGGQLVARLSVPAVMAGRAAREGLRALESLLRRPPDGGELAVARQAIRQQLGQRLQSNADLADALVPYALFDLPPGGLGKLEDGLLQVTPERAAEVAVRYLRPDATSVVVVGDAALVEPDLRALVPLPIEHEAHAHGR
jgi:zinc protease